MPDLQSELKKLEHFAFDDEGSTTDITMTLPHTFQPTNNVSRETFNYIKNNPGVHRKNVVIALEHLGFKSSSTASLIGQFIRRGSVRQVNGYVFATSDEFVPVKSLRQKKSKVAKVTAKKSEAPIIEAVTQPAVNHNTSVKDMLAGMSIVQAREMYDELRRIFAA